MNTNGIVAISTISGDKPYPSIQGPSDWMTVNVDLNRGAGGKFIYFIYKPGFNVPIQNTVKDLHIQVSTRPDDPPPIEYFKIQQDLNEGVEGAFIYACYSIKPTEKLPITAIHIVAGNSPDVSVPPNYIKIPIDLNAGAGGEFIYLCYTRTPIANAGNISTLIDFNGDIVT